MTNGTLMICFSDYTFLHHFMHSNCSDERSLHFEIRTGKTASIILFDHESNENCVYFIMYFKPQTMNSLIYFIWLDNGFRFTYSKAYNKLITLQTLLFYFFFLDAINDFYSRTMSLSYQLCASLNYDLSNQ